MANSGTRSDYFGWGRILSIFLAIIPVTAWILGIITRFSDGGVGGTVAGLIRLFGFGMIIWIVDLILMIARGRILRIL